MFNKNALKAKVVENGLTMGKLASMLGIDYATLWRKMSGISDFNRSEIHEIILALNLSSADINRIFLLISRTDGQNLSKEQKICRD